jgi:hypothetical protein
LIYVFEEGTAHANINKVLDRRNPEHRWLVIADDDVEFLTDRWLDKMIEVMERHKDVGMLVPGEVKSEEDRDKYLETLDRRTDQGTLKITSWNAGYVMLFDMDRLDPIRADEDIPGPSGMSDVDLSFQVRSQGYKCALTVDVGVYHPWKPTDIEWRKKWDIVLEHELPELSDEQGRYMRQKWGDFLGVNGNHRVLETRKS